MKKKILEWFIILTTTIGAFLYFATIINSNSPTLDTDEVYWISTARIVPILLHRDFQNIFWHEHIGFVNFNGAKIIYGIGLTIFGHVDFSPAGIPPNTYYQSKQFEGKPLSRNNPLFPLLYHARFISAVFATASVLLMFIIAKQVFQSIIPSLIVTVLFTMHSVFLRIAVHALADSIFLFFELASLLIFILILQELQMPKGSGKIKLYILLGLFLAYLTSIKINGVMFLFTYGAFIFSIYIEKLNVLKIKEFIRNSATVLCAFVTGFTVLHPNFFFYPSYSLLQMIKDRVYITLYHRDYFLIIDPSHVSLTIPQRFFSLIHYSFYPIMTVFFIIGLGITILRFIFIKHIKVNTIYQTMLVVGIITTFWLISYVLFDEGRYFIPLLPFLVLICGYPFSLIKIK
jgi:hypothetical protein